MPNNTQVAPKLQQSISSAIEAIDLHHTCLDDLRMLFRAIIQSDDQDNVVRGLANVGQYLCEDFQHIADCALDRLNELKGII